MGYMIGLLYLILAISFGLKYEQERALERKGKQPLKFRKQFYLIAALVFVALLFEQRGVLDSALHLIDRWSQ